MNASKFITMSLFFGCFGALFAMEKQSVPETNWAQRFCIMFAGNDQNSPRYKVAMKLELSKSFNIVHKKLVILDHDKKLSTDDKDELFGRLYVILERLRNAYAFIQKSNIKESKVNDYRSMYLDALSLVVELRSYCPEDRRFYEQSIYSEPYNTETHSAQFMTGTPCLDVSEDVESDLQCP
jgi:hypothetical protein